MQTKPIFILQFADPTVSLANSGGKGLSLSKLTRAGFPIPNGFHITTETYRYFITVNDLQGKILGALKDVDAALPASLETASASIHRFFAEASIPAEIAESICASYLSLGISNSVPVAVRSSATAEDLPEASFAGQQETYLNIHGEEALLAAVKKC